MNSDNFVEVANAYKCFEKGHNVLNGLNMTVPTGKIYGLLGPSGCGKTTLLQCVLNRITLDSGQVRVKNNDQRSSIGYMPQHISLYQELSVKENIIYFGILSGLKDDVIDKKMEELLQFLLLGDRNAIVQNLSGGQRRRVSFAVSLLNEAANLLILDEPTVGVDPVLSSSIWQYLLEIVSSKNKTVIITTHYIEEARNAHVVGFMRYGQILTESSPNDLMRDYKCDTLEEVFLSLISESSSDKLLEAQKKPNLEASNEPTKKKETKKFSIERTKAMLRRNIYSMKRNIGVLLFVTFLPMLLCTLFCNVIGGNFPNLKFAMVNKEPYQNSATNSPLSNQTCDFSKSLSRKFENELVRLKYILVEYDDIESAKKSNSWAVISIRENFSQALEHRIDHSTDSITVDSSDIDVHIDATNYLIWAQVKSDLVDGYIQFIRDIYGDCGWTTGTAIPAIRFMDPIYGETKYAYMQSIALLYYVGTTHYFVMTLTMTNIRWERSDGKLERTLIAGGTLLEMCVSHAIIQIIVASISMVACWHIMITIYGIPYIGDVILGVITLYLISFAGVAQGTLIGVATTVEFFAQGTVVVVGFSNLFLCGLVWPIEGMHWTLKWVRPFFPAVTAFDTFNSVALRGWSYSNSVIYLGLFNSVVWIILVLIGIVLVTSRKNSILL